MATPLLSPLKDFCQCIPPGPFLRRFLRGVSCSGALRVIYAFFSRKSHLSKFKLLGPFYDLSRHTRWDAGSTMLPAYRCLYTRLYIWGYWLVRFKFLVPSSYLRVWPSRGQAESDAVVPSPGDWPWSIPLSEGLFLLQTWMWCAWHRRLEFLSNLYLRWVSVDAAGLLK